MESTLRPETTANATAVSTELPISPNAMAALGYAFAPAAIAALVMKQYEKDAGVRFHAIHSLVVRGAFLMVSMAFAIVTGVMTALASMVLGALGAYTLISLVFRVTSLLSLALSLGALGLWVTLIVTAAQGKRFKVPILSDLAERIGKH